jgi:hypothetical protein
MKPGSLNLLEPSGPHRACYGTALPFTCKDAISFREIKIAITWNRYFTHFYKPDDAPIGLKYVALEQRNKICFLTN